MLRILSAVKSEHAQVQCISCKVPLPVRRYSFHLEYPGIHGHVPPGVYRPHLIRGHVPPRVHTPNDIAIGSAVSAQLVVVTSRHTANDSSKTI